MKILFRADCDRTVGTGHLIRCREMASYFYAQGWDVRFLVNDIGFIDKALNGHNYIKMPFGDLPDEITKTREILSNDFYDIIIVDFYQKYQNEDLMAVYAAHAAQVAAVSDDFQKVNVKADVLLAPHPRQSRHHYADEKQRRFLGEKYFVVSQEFIDNTITPNREVKEVLVSMGGHDPDNAMSAVMKNLISVSKTHNLSDITFNILIGGMYRYEEELSALLSGSSLMFRFYKNLPTVLPVFLRSDLAVSACGNTLYELCNLNVPVIGIGLNSRQHEGGACLSEKDLIAYAGFLTQINAADFNRIFTRLTGSYKERLGYHDRCREHFTFNPVKKIYSTLKGEPYEAQR